MNNNTSSNISTDASTFYLRRADAYHTALFVIGILLVAQVTAFANLVGGGSGDGGGFICQTQTHAARIAVFVILIIFLIAYHVAIIWTGRMEARWRTLAGVDDGGLTRRLTSAVIAINVVTTLIAAGLFGVGTVLRVCV